jgi:hypothetical protein
MQSEDIALFKIVGFFVIFAIVIIMIFSGLAGMK